MVEDEEEAPKEVRYVVVFVCWMFVAIFCACPRVFSCVLGYWWQLLVTILATAVFLM